MSVSHRVDGPFTKGANIMTDLLVKMFVKNYEDTDNISVRTAYGVLASGVAGSSSIGFV